MNDNINNSPENLQDNTQPSPHVYIPTRKVGILTGFSSCNADYLAIVNRETELNASPEELSLLQKHFRSLQKDPSVADLFFALAAYRRGRLNSSFDLFLEAVDLCSDDEVFLLTELSRRLSRESYNSEIPPTLTELAAFAAGGRIEYNDCGIFICPEDHRISPPPYSGISETFASCGFAVTLSAGKKISGNKAGDICVILAPKDGQDLGSFINDSGNICRLFCAEHPETLIISASERGLIYDLLNVSRGWTVDTSLLPDPSAFAETIFKPASPALLLFPRREQLVKLWKTAAEYGITPHAPAATRSKGISVLAAEGTIETDQKILSSFNFSLPAKLKCDINAVLQKKDCDIFDLSVSDHSMTVREVGGKGLYEELSDAMSDKNAVYAVTGTIDPNDNSFIPSVLTLDAYRRNNEPNVIYSRFFIGNKSRLCVIKLAEKK